MQRVDQRRIDDLAILGQQRRAEHQSGRDENSVCRIAVKGVGERVEYRRHGPRLSQCSSGTAGSTMSPVTMTVPLSSNCGYLAWVRLAGLPQLEYRLAAAEGRLAVLLGGYRDELDAILPDTL